LGLAQNVGKKFKFMAPNPKQTPIHFNFNLNLRLKLGVLALPKLQT